MKFIGNGFAEFKGQIIDVFENYFEEHKIVLNNKDKEAAIKDGCNKEELAIIYGEDYDFILNALNWYVDDNNQDYVLTGEDAVSVINGLIEYAQNLILPQRSIYGAEYAILASKIKDILHHWDLLSNYAEGITISCKLENESDLDNLSKQTKGHFYVCNKESDTCELLDGWTVKDIKDEIPIGTVAFLSGPPFLSGAGAYQAIEYADIGHKDSFEQEICLSPTDYSNGHSLFMICGAAKEEVLLALKNSSLPNDGIYNFSYKEDTKTATFDSFSKYPEFCGLQDISSMLENARVYAVNEWEWHNKGYPVYAYKNGIPIDLTGEFIPTKEECFANDSKSYRFEATYTDSCGESFYIWNLIDLENKNSLKEVLALCPGLKELDSYKEFFKPLEGGIEI